MALLERFSSVTLGPGKHIERRGIEGNLAYGIEDLFLRPAVSVLLFFATIPECSQNQTAVSDTLRLFSDF